MDVAALFAELFRLLSQVPGTFWGVIAGSIFPQSSALRLCRPSLLLPLRLRLLLRRQGWVIPLPLRLLPTPGWPGAKACL
jgi:hypothetical protein